MGKKLFKAIIIVLAVLIVLPVNVFAAGDDVIQNDKTGIPDKALYRAILRELGKSKTEKFTQEEAAGITQLEVRGNKKKYQTVKTLKGIGNLTGLVFLAVSGNELKTLRGIRSLDSLEALYAGANKLTDVSEVKYLTELTYLNLVGNKIRKLPNLKGLTKLESADTSFSHNCIKEKELKNKLPDHLLKYVYVKKADKKKNEWLKSQIIFQNITEEIKLVTPGTVKEINTGTTEIAGKAQKGSSVVLRNIFKNKIIKKVKADKKGNFYFRKLDLTQCKGQELVISSSLYNGYYGENWELGYIAFNIKR